MESFNLYAEVCVEVNAEVEAETLEEAQEILVKKHHQSKGSSEKDSSSGRFHEPVHPDIQALLDDD